MKFKQVFEAIGSPDRDWGGGGPDFRIGLFETHFEAAEAAKGRGGWGRDGQVRSRDVVVEENGDTYLVEGKVEVYKTTRDMERKIALSKLTDKDRELLGLK